MFTVPFIKRLETSGINCHQMKFSKKTELAKKLLPDKPTDQIRLQLFEFPGRQKSKHVIYGIPMIMGGAGLLGAKNLFATLPGVDPALLPALEKQRSAFKMLGWGYIMMFVFTILFMIVYGIFIFAFVAKMKGLAQ